MARVSMTYGVMPMREQFDAACLDHDPDDPPEACVANLGFDFHNDKRVGDVTLTPDELWEELRNAHVEWEAGSEEAGDWCSSVLGCLGFEWI